ncbi:MAG: Uma2 family endonuclease [Polyangiaceae bacterium]|nr:Uma2 family endonuclease [Polyangiaceae bacterium]MCL4754267.1 Uma2 family endonuclease [Myxococcales bacterium]
MIAPAPRRRYSYEEYLAFEQTANVKHEYFAGEIYAMAGGTPEHAALAANVTTLLGVALRGRRCRVHSADLRVRVRQTGLATYPDVTVVCGAAESDPADPSTIVNPSVLVEVTSKSTEDYDRGEKLEHYQHIPSVKEITLVSHRERRLDVFTRTDSGEWRHDSFGPGQSAELGSLGCALSVDDVCHDALTGQSLVG